MEGDKTKRLYCYVDESGQDPALNVFIVVAVVSAAEQEAFREALMEIEQLAGVGHGKWHGSKPARRLRYIELALERDLGRDEVFFGTFQKPLPYFFPMMEVVEDAIKVKAGSSSYSAKVFVDGIDRKKAGELTNALRLRGISLGMIRGRRDESEPIIRLADMWAGCIRGATQGKAEERTLLRNAMKTNYIRCTKGKTP
jgi:hypothetical protein